MEITKTNTDKIKSLYLILNFLKFFLIITRKNLFIKLAFIEKQAKNIESFEKPQIQNFLRRTLKRFPSEIEGYSKSSIDNCISYSIFVLQFSICITAMKSAISHAVTENCIVYVSCIAQFSVCTIAK